MSHKELSGFVNGHLGCPLLSAVSLYQMCLAVCHQTVSGSQAVLCFQLTLLGGWQLLAKRWAVVIGNLLSLLEFN